MTVDRASLKPCPFCGGKALATTRRRVKCAGCGVISPDDGDFFSPAQDFVALWNTHADLTRQQGDHQKRSHPQITARSVAEVRNEALEEAAQAMQPVLRTMLSRGAAADLIRALKSQPVPAPVQDEAHIECEVCFKDEAKKMSDANKGSHPGSKSAIAKGCICPILDNEHGKGCLGNGSKYGWFVNDDCRLHGEQKEHLYD